jgi:hypothetical protein
MTVGLNGVCGVVHKNFEVKAIILVLSHSEAVVSDQKPVASEPVAVEQLVALAITGPMSHVHGKKHIF